jgi:hypothetical protein
MTTRQHVNRVGRRAFLSALVGFVMFAGGMTAGHLLSLNPRYRCREDLVLRRLIGVGFSAKSLSMQSACGALQKLVQRLRGCEDWPSRNRHDDGEKQRFDYKFPTLFPREIAPA